MDRFTGRRKLIRGSLSAPLVLTVASPAALARQSFEACLDRASQQLPPKLEPFSTERDGFVRKTVDVYRGKLTKDGPEELFYKTQVVRKDGVLVDRYARLEGCGEKPHRAKEFVDGPHFDRKRYALVHVNEKGEVVHIGACPTGQKGFPVTGSCWASFGGGAI
jgi:hypothetical protein